MLIIYLSKTWLFRTKKPTPKQNLSCITEHSFVNKFLWLLLQRKRLRWKSAGCTASSSLKRNINFCLTQKHFCWEREHHRPVLKKFQCSYQAISWIIPSLHADFSFSRVLVQAELAICWFYSHYRRFWRCGPNLDFPFLIIESISTLALHICSWISLLKKKITLYFSIASIFYQQTNSDILIFIYLNSHLYNLVTFFLP